MAGLFWQAEDRYSRSRYLIEDEIFLNKKLGRDTPSNFVENSDGRGCILRIADRFHMQLFIMPRRVALA